jgi:dipeptidyl aminopeptidase/acylaminoacyl peptidase
MKEEPIVVKSNGKQIIGILHLATKKNAPLVIMCHGWGANKLGTWSGLFVNAARVFCKNNLNVLRFDFTGSGDSEGKFENQNIETQLKDLKNLIEAMKKSEKDMNLDKLGIVGHSRGGELALIFAAENKNIKCVATWSSPAGIMELWSPALLSELYERKYVILDNLKITLRNFKLDLKYDLRKIVKKIKCPVLVIGCENDDVVPPSQAKKIYNMLSSKNKKMCIIKSDHYFTTLEAQSKVIKLTLNWFKKWLK